MSLFYGNDCNTNLVGYAMDGTGHIQSMINYLHDLSQVSSNGKPFEPVNCEDIVVQVCDDLKCEIEKATIAANRVSFSAIYIFYDHNFMKQTLLSQYSTLNKIAVFYAVDNILFFNLLFLLMFVCL